MPLLTWNLGYRSYNVMEPLFDALRAGREDVVVLSNELAGILLGIGQPPRWQDDDIRRALGFLIATEVAVRPENCGLGFGLWSFRGDDCVVRCFKDVIGSGIGGNGVGFRGELRALANEYAESACEGDALSQVLVGCFKTFGFLHEVEFAQLSWRTTFRFADEAEWRNWQRVLERYAARAVPLHEWAADYDLRRRVAGERDVWDRDFEIGLRRLYAGWIMETFRKSPYLSGWYYGACVDVMSIDEKADEAHLRAVKNWGDMSKRAPAEAVMALEAGRDVTGGLVGIEEWIKVFGAKRRGEVERYRERNARFWRERMELASKILSRREWFRSQGHDVVEWPIETLRERLLTAAFSADNARAQVYRAIAG